MDEIIIDDASGDEYPLGSLLDSYSLWKALHLDTSEYEGALSMAASDVIVGAEEVIHCLGGVTSAKEFAKSLQVEVRRVTDKSGYTTGQNVEIFAISPTGEKINIGVRSIRSKQGILGKLDTTYQYHKDFQNCLDTESR